MDDLAAVTDRVWDCVVVGTGVGGATLGHALAAAGQRVLFVEKGRAGLEPSDGLRGFYPETHFEEAALAAPRQQALLRQGGRWSEEVLSGGGGFVPLLGCGGGGSSALFGMAMERFFPEDFRPGPRLHALAGGSSLPDAWPVSYEEMLPFYRRAERLYRVRGARDPLRPADEALPAAPVPGPHNAELARHFAAAGLHPYRLPLACEFVNDCACCQGFLCARDCKNDAARSCLRPAVREHGAVLLDECEAITLEAAGDRITALVCRRHGTEFRVRARHYALGAGALVTPCLLLSSRSPGWPDGLANRSGLVGRNLMRHGVDLYLVFTRARGDPRSKEIGLSDFYVGAGEKLGTLQSFGALPPASMLATEVIADASAALPFAGVVAKAMRPLLERGLAALFRRGVLLAGIMEDLPYPDNRIEAGDPPRVHYVLREPDRARLRLFRQGIARALKPYRFLPLRQAEKNRMLAHVCGTCRFGDDPASSVLDRNNRAHGVANLYVVDASFFPSSGGTNPALTIAANALRVAEHMLTRNHAEV